MITLAILVAFFKAHTTILLYVALAMVNALPLPGSGFQFYPWFYSVAHSLANKGNPTGSVVPVTTTTTMAPQAVTQRVVVTPVEDSGGAQRAIVTPAVSVPAVSAPGA